VSEWFYIDGEGASVGPVSFERLLEDNLSVPDFYVFTEGMAEWKLASLMPEIEKRRNWRLAAATEAQKNRLRLYQIEICDGLTKGQASDIIEECKRRKTKATPEARAAYQKNKREQHLNEVQAKINDAFQALRDGQTDGLTLSLLIPEVQEACETLIDELQMEVERMDGEVVDEDRQQELKAFLSEFAPDGDWAAHFNKPTRRQAEEVLEELHRRNPANSMISDVDFVRELERRFPDLRKR
jgi:hypothetical protein